MQRRRLGGAWSAIWRSFTSCAIWVFWACNIVNMICHDDDVVSIVEGQAHLNCGVELLEVQRYVILHVVLHLPPQNL
jgi:hypothetical protein